MDDYRVMRPHRCPDPKLCRKLRRHLNGRLWDIWRGVATGLSAEVQAAYRESWLRAARRRGARGEVMQPFTRIVLVNLPRRPDRLNAALAQLRPPLWELGIPQLFQAIDGSRVPTPPAWEQGAGAWGCMQSHRQIVEQALLDDVDHLLVLEDDLVLRRGFGDGLRRFLAAVPADADGLFLGGQHHHPSEPVAPGIVRCINTQRTHAYSGRRRWLEELYKAWCSPRATVHCDWLMGPMCGRFKIYAPDPFLIGQARGKSDICGREQPAKFWQAPTGREPVVILRAERALVDQLREYGWHTGFQRDQETGYDVGLIQVVRGGKALADWIVELQWEVVSEEGWHLVIWHPSITVEQVKAAWPGPVLEIVAKCASGAVQQYRTWLACRPSVSA